MEVVVQSVIFLQEHLSMVSETYKKDSDERSDEAGEVGERAQWRLLLVSVADKGNMQAEIMKGSRAIRHVTFMLGLLLSGLYTFMVGGITCLKSALRHVLWFCYNTAPPVCFSFLSPMLTMSACNVSYINSELTIH